MQEEIIPTHGSIEKDGQLHDALEFLIDESRSAGILHMTCEINLYYDLEDETWHGDIINADGWEDLDDEDIAEIVEKYDLETVNVSVIVWFCLL